MLENSYAGILGKSHRAGYNHWVTIGKLELH